MIVAGEVAIELPVMVGVEADDDGENPENTIVVGFGLALTFPRGAKEKGTFARGKLTYVTKTPKATMALLMPQAPPHRSPPL